jgi:hypothetical protein
MRRKHKVEVFTLQTEREMCPILRRLLHHIERGAGIDA